ELHLAVLPAPVPRDRAGEPEVGAGRLPGVAARGVGNLRLARRVHAELGLSDDCGRLRGHCNSRRGDRRDVPRPAALASGGGVWGGVARPADRAAPDRVPLVHKRTGAVPAGSLSAAGYRIVWPSGSAGGQPAAEVGTGAGVRRGPAGDAAAAGHGPGKRHGDVLHMSARTTLITFSLLAVLGLAGLLVSATEPRPSTAFSLDVPPNVAVAILGSHQPVCQGPIETTASFGSVIAWISPGPVPGPSTAPPGPAVDM